MPRKKPEQPEWLRAEIAKNFEWARDFHSDMHKHGARCVDFVAGNPWDGKDLASRDEPEQKRPALIFDQATQYINQFMGQWRQQDRGVHIEPEDEQADGDTAAMMQARMYHIEYISRAASHYAKAVKDVATRSYGFIKVGKKYSGPRGRLQETCIVPISNPDSVLMDPNCKEMDSSDAKWYFVFDPISMPDAKRSWPWVEEFKENTSNTAIIAEYWRVSRKGESKTTLYKDSEGGELEVDSDEIPEDFNSDEYAVDEEREHDEKVLTCYTCLMPEVWSEDKENRFQSVQLLETTEWPEYDCINCVSFYGESYWVGSPGQQKPVKLSMISRALDPMQALNYTRTTQAEMASMMPKTLFFAYEGQFENQEDPLIAINRKPRVFIYAKAATDDSERVAPGTILPLPQAVKWEPPIHNLEVYAQALENAIRSSIGQLASPELDKAKSGIAIERIKAGGESAVYHIVQNAEFSLQQVGRLYLKGLRATHDSARHVPVRMPNGETRRIGINQPWSDPKTGKTVNYDFTKGEYSCTISTGPSYQSQFDAAKEFTQTLVKAVPELLLDGTGHTTVGDLVVKAQNLGPQGDVLADRMKILLRPELKEDQQNADPQAMALQKQAQEVIDQLTEHLNAAQKIIDEKQIESQTQIKIHEMDNETKIRVAEIGQVGKVSIMQTEAELEAADQQREHANDAAHKLADQDHEVGLKLMDQEHQSNMGAQQQSHDVEMAAQNAALQAQQPAEA